MKRNLLIITLLFFMTISITGCGNNSTGTNSIKKSMGNTSSGNTSGNLANNGLVVENKDYIFHALYGEGNGIYKLSKKDSSIFESEVFIPNIYAYDLNIVGDYLYYVAYENKSPNYIEIRKTKLDGSKTETIEKVSSQTYHLQLNVTKDYIYYYNDKEEAIYKISVNGGKNQKVADVYADRGMYVSNGWIYYGSGNGKLGKIKTDGSNNTTLFTGSINSNSMIVDNGYVYFWPYEYKGSYSDLYRIKADGSEEDPAKLPKKYINIYDDWMYYSNKNYEGYSKSKVDGSNQVKLSGKAEYVSYSHDYILLTDDWVYGYIPLGSDSWAVFEVKKDGTDYKIKDCNGVSNAECIK